MCDANHRSRRKAAAEIERVALKEAPMLSWKVVLAGIIFLYLLFASAISLFVQYAAMGVLTTS